MHIKILISGLLLSIFSNNAFCDWHSGKVTQINVGYDGKTVSFKMDGWTRMDCTCYPTWPTYMCLDPARGTFGFEKALLLSTRMTGNILHAEIEETSCTVKALYETTK